MNTVQRIAKNTGVLLASQVVSYAIGFFFVMYTARYLGAGGFGVMALDELGEKMDGVIVTVVHDEFRGMGLSGVGEFLGEGAVLENWRGL
ncbi:MAG: hypothetical protein U9N61_12610 [Euryarchaeota archaeon]|nr:hypothetical protein [Euryarchaeota archaeon]